MFGEGTNRENNKKPYFPVTGGFALDNEGHMGLQIGRWRIHE